MKLKVIFMYAEIRNYDSSVKRFCDFFTLDYLGDSGQENGQILTPVLSVRKTWLKEDELC